MARGGRKAIVSVGGDTSALESALGRSRKGLKKWSAGIKRDVGSSLKSAFSSLSSIAGFAGVAGIGLAIRDFQKFDERLTRLGISSGKSAAEMEKMRVRIRDVSMATGVAAEEVLTAQEAYFALTGDAKGAADSMSLFAKVNAATGAPMEDIAKTAAALKDNLGLASDEMEKAFSILTVQGKEGAIELKDMAALAAGIAPSFEQFGNKGTTALSEMGAVLQVLRKGFGTSEEAATGLESVMGAIVKNGKDFKKVGVKTFEVDEKGNKRLRAFSDIVFDLIDKTKGDPEKIMAVLGRKEAYQAVIKLMQKGRGEVERLVEAGESSNIIEKDFQTFQNSRAGKFAQAQAKMKAAFQDSIARNADSIARAMEKMAEAVDFIVRHPITSALGLTAGKLGPGLISAMMNTGRGAGGGVKAALEEAGGSAGLKFGLVAKGFIVAAAAIAGTAIGNEINKAVDRHTDTDADKSNRAVNKRSLGISASADKKRRRAAQLQNSGKISDQKEAERLLREADAEELQVAQKSSYNPLTKKVTPLAGVTDFLQGKGLMPSDEAMSGATAVNQGYGRKIEALKRRKKELGTPVHKEIDMEIAELEKQLMTFTINFKAGEGFSIGLDNSRGLRKGGD